MKMLKISRGGELVPLWIEHTTDNEDEMLRLSHLGCKLTGEEGQATAVLGQLKYTRLDTLIVSNYKRGCRIFGKIIHSEVPVFYTTFIITSVYRNPCFKYLILYRILLIMQMGGGAFKFFRLRYYFLKVYLHDSSKIKSNKEVTNSRNIGFLTIFVL
jgi:hypothetical protein